MRRAAVLLALVPLPCAKKAPPEPAPIVQTPTTVQSATTPIATATATATVTAPPPGPDPADRAAIETAKAQASAIEWCATHNVLKDPKRPDDPDAVAQCAALDGERPRLDAIASRPPELARMLDDAKRYCSLDVPLISAAEGLRQSQLSPSQASRRMTCGFAQKDIAKAKAYKPDDRRVRDLDARIKRACQ